MKHVIIGDGVAGHTAADTIREEQLEADIHVFTKESVPFYDRIGLRDFIRGGREEEDLFFGGEARSSAGASRSTDSERSVRGEKWYEERSIQIHLDTKVTAIDRDAQTVETAEGESFSYDRLLLAVGGQPRTLPMEEGVDKVHHLWTLEDHGRELRRHLEESEEGVVIGGGLLGFDLIGSFNEVVDSTYLVREDRWWHSVLTEEGAGIMHEAMREHGVNLRLNEECQGLEEGDEVRVVTGGGEYETGVVGIAVGHVRNLELAENAGLETDRGIICDEHLQTDDENIYAAGDAAEYQDPVLEKRNLGGSWITAQEQGMIAGKNMIGEEEPLEFVDTYTVNHFGLNVASLGDPADTEGKEVVTAVDKEEQKYRKVVLEDGRIVGAAILGEMKWMHPLKQLILNKVDVSGRVKDLESPDFNPGELL